MNFYDEFLHTMIQNNIVFTQKDYDYFNHINNSKTNQDILNLYKHNLNVFNYQLSKNFFGKEYFHPKNVNPYRVNYDLYRIMNELKLKDQKIKYKDKIDKIVNYINYIN